MVLMTVTVNLWKSESPVSELQKLLGLFVDMRSIVLEFSGFLKHVLDGRRLPPSYFLQSLVFCNHFEELQTI